MQELSQKLSASSTGDLKETEKGVDTYFKSLLPDGKAYFTQDRELGGGLQVIDLSRIPYNAMSLYLTGFPYLALEEAAAELLKKASAETLQRLIEKKKNQYPSDVPILEKALALKKVGVNGNLPVQKEKSD
ncbi:hypothetical protein [Capnocytophaga ochracea]|jgi:hypothetical protein|uniref:Uncharacterized protein n=1 Tax=Capnocytophaga ochracea TaxID=1018 RepID=A0A2X2SPN5_CAPOC|nr:hypothetical protein [Capnocytophaga ochracea]SQA93794.1 Uncharacterised protein [Capnocytophaga ochracea]